MKLEGKAMSEPIVLVERDGPVAIVTMNRPDALNALSRALRSELVKTFTDLAADDTVRAAILTGAGRAFTAGVDLKEAGQTGFALGADGGEIDLAKGLAAFPWPIIGAINGFAITGGFELALMCDVLLASENAKFADTHARVGIMPGWGLSQKLSRLIGISRAKELSFTGSFLDAETAAQWGLVNRVYGADELMPAAKAMAHEMATCDPVLLRNYKKVIDDGFAQSFGEATKMEVRRSAEHAANVTADSVEQARQAVTARGRTLND
jgi:enoyl-CoA hydratase